MCTQLITIKAKSRNALLALTDLAELLFETKTANQNEFHGNSQRVDERSSYEWRTGTLCSLYFSGMDSNSSWSLSLLIDQPSYGVIRYF